MSGVIQLPVFMVDFNGTKVYPGDTVNIKRPGRGYLRCTIIHIGEKRVKVRPNQRVKRSDGTYGIKVGKVKTLNKSGLEVTAIRDPSQTRVEQDPAALREYKTNPERFK